MSKQIDFLKRCIALNLQSGGLLDLLDRIEELERERDALRADNAELVTALESVEWTQLGEMPKGKHCCYCGALEKHGHVTGCKVAISLKRTTLAQALSKVRKP